MDFSLFSQGNRCNEALPRGVLVGSSHERETMTKKKSMLVVAGVLAMGYAIVSTNAFADSSTTPTTATTTTSTTAVVTPIVPAAPTAPTASTGIQAPPGLQDPSATMPNADENNSDDQAENQAGDQTDSATENDGQNADVSVDVNDNQDGNVTTDVAATVDANVNALVGTTSADGNQGSDNQGDSGSND